MQEDNVRLFCELFAGRVSAYGVHVPSNETDESGKRKGRSYTKTAALTPEVYSNHLTGKESLGIVPLREDNTVLFAAIDIDIYPVDVKKYCAIFDGYNLPFTCFSSKSGGLHAYVFFREPVPAVKLLPMLREVVAVIGLPATTEVFPKQADAKKVGNWINLPYFDAKKSTRQAYDLSGKALSFDNAMQFCAARRVTLAALDEAITALPLHDGPPCLQSLLVSGEVLARNHNRNVFVFNAAAYCKQVSPEGYEQKVHQFNQWLTEPLPYEEVESTILASYRKGNYTYKCSEACLSMYCRKSECYKRKYGKQRSDLLGLDFGELRQIMVEPPYYEWDINGRPCYFKDETELADMKRVNAYCIRHLHKALPPMKQSAWIDILNTALATMLVVDKPLTYRSTSPMGLLRSQLREFLTNRAQATRAAQVVMGLVFKDRKLGYVFRMQSFTDWLAINKHTRVTSMSSELSRLLSEMNAKTRTLQIGEQQLTVWTVPSKEIDSETITLDDDFLTPDQFETAYALEDVDSRRALYDAGYTDEDLQIKEGF